MSRSAMESFFSSLRTERTANKTYRTQRSRADVFDYIERSYNAKRRHSTIGYLSPMKFERKAEPVSFKPAAGQLRQKQRRDRPKNCRDQWR
jgi:Integrase core domain